MIRLTNRIGIPVRGLARDCHHESKNVATAPGQWNGLLRNTVMVVSCILLLASCSASHTEFSIDRGDPIAGKQVYRNNCAACHGENLEGQPDWQTLLPSGLLPAPPHDASGHTWHHDDVLLFEYTKYGGAGVMARKGLEGMVSGMPAFEQLLSDQQILDVLAFIRASWPADIQTAQRQRNNR